MVSILSLILVLVSAFLGALGTFVLKKGTLQYSLRSFVLSRFFWGGIILYGLGTVLYVLALRQEPLSSLYPLISTTYIWAALLSLRIGERMNTWKWMGLLGIILGVMVMNLPV